VELHLEYLYEVVDRLSPSGKIFSRKHGYDFSPVLERVGSMEDEFQ
jgi:hypothetical protein